MVKGSLKDKSDLHRYKVWQVAKGDPRLANGAAAAAASQPRPAIQVTKVSDFETLRLLYIYGRPMDMAAESKCTLSNRLSATCKTKTVTSETVDLVYGQISSEAPEQVSFARYLGVNVALDVDEVGTFRGVVTEDTGDGFRVTINRDNRTKLSTSLAQIAVKRGLGIDAIDTMRIDAQRIEPKNKNCGFTDHSGILRKAHLVNLSQFDALIKGSAAIMPPLGSRIVLRGPEWHGANVISTFEIGFMVKFCVPIPEDSFTNELVFADIAM